MSLPSFGGTEIPELPLERTSLRSFGGDWLSGALGGAEAVELYGRKLTGASDSISGGVMSAEMYSSSWFGVCTV